MTSLLQRVDDFLIDRVSQPFSDWFQERTGKNCFFLAHLLFWVVLMCFTALAFLAYVKGEEVSRFVAISPLVLLYLGWLLPAIKKEQLRWEESHSNLMNSIRLTWRPIRLINTVFAAFFLPVDIARIFLSILEGSLNLIETVSVTMGFYLIACTPKPPSPFRKTEGVFTSIQVKAS